MHTLLPEVLKGRSHFKGLGIDGGLNRMRVCGVNSSGSGGDLVGVICEHDNEYSGSIKRLRFLGQLSYY
jgi:hypothetical protein